MHDQPDYLTEIVVFVAAIASFVSYGLRRGCKTGRVISSRGDQYYDIVAPALMKQPMPTLDELLHTGCSKRWRERREGELRQGLSPSAKPNEKVSVFINIKSRSLVLAGTSFSLLVIILTILSSLVFKSDLQGLIYPFISETARDMPQCGFFGFGMTISSVFMICAAVLQFGKVKREIGDNTVGSKRNVSALVAGISAPPFLGLLACYDTRRALNTHRTCVVIFFSLFGVYMLTVVSIYNYLASLNKGGRKGKRGCPRASQIKHVQFSVKIKMWIASLFIVLTTFYLPIGSCLVSDFGHETYHPDDVMLHAIRAMCQHLAVICIILFYGTFYYDFDDLNLYLVHR